MYSTSRFSGTSARSACAAAQRLRELAALEQGADPPDLGLDRRGLWACARCLHGPLNWGAEAIKKSGHCCPL